MNEFPLVGPYDQLVEEIYHKIRSVHGTAYGWEPPHVPSIERLSSTRMREYVKGLDYRMGSQAIAPEETVEIELTEMKQDYSEDVELETSTEEVPRSLFGRFLIAIVLPVLKIDREFFLTVHTFRFIVLNLEGVKENVMDLQPKDWLSHGSARVSAAIHSTGWIGCEICRVTESDQDKALRANEFGQDGAAKMDLAQSMSMLRTRKSI